MSTQSSQATIPQQWETDLKAWEEAQAQEAKDKAELLKMAAMISTMGNPLVGAQMIMMQVMQVQGDQAGSLAAVDNIESDIRGGVTTAQGDMNSMNGDVTSGNQNQLNADTQKFSDAVDALQEFLNSFGTNGPISPSDIASMTSEINGIKSHFGSDWGNGSAMAGTFENWVQEQNQQGMNSPDLAGIQTGFQTLNQYASAFSTTTNTALQYTTQVFQQIEGITNDTMQTYQKLVSGFVNNQRAS